MSVSHVTSLTTVGLDGIVLDVECDLGLGLPSFAVVGLPDKAVEEAKERVRAAFKNTQLSFPQHRLTVNLAPADIKKSGSFYDLPIAVGIAIAMGFIEQTAVEKCAMMGELSLGGEVRAVSGVLPAVLHAREVGIDTLFVPFDNAAEAALVKEVRVVGVKQFRDLYMHLRGETVLKAALATKIRQNQAPVSTVDMAHIRGQAQVKRALEIAAAGGHNVLKMWSQINTFVLN